MRVENVTDTLNLALAASGCDNSRLMQRPRLLSDNGPCYIAGGLADWLSEKNLKHTRGSPSHPQTQGKIERWHQTMKNRILLENYFLPGDLEAQIAAFVEHYNHRRYHEPRQSHARRRLLRARPDHSAATTKDQAKDHRTAALAPSQGRRLI